VVSVYTSGFPTKTLNTHFPSPIHATCSARIILLDFITRTILGEELSSSLYSFLHSPVTLSLLGPNILLTPYSETPSAYAPPSLSATKRFSLILCIKEKVLPKLEHLYNLEEREREREREIERERERDAGRLVFLRKSISFLDSCMLEHSDCAQISV